MERNNFIRKILIFVLLLAISFLVVGKNPKAYAFVTDQNTGNETDVIITRKATIDDNFTEDALLITLTQDAIFNFRQYSTLDFPEINLVSVTEITDELYSRVEQQIRNDANGISNKTNSDSKIDVDSFRRIFKLELLEPGKENVLKAIELLEKRDDIRSAEPNYIGEFSTLSPNDPASIDQWALNYLQLPNAWYLSAGSSTVRVGIADSGIDRNHPDLVGRINETLSRDHSGGGNPWFTTNVHGTHVAGIVGATGNNSLGITGVNWNVELVSLKVGNQEPTAAAVAAAITFANANEIRVLNLSLSINETQAINDAINAFDGVIVCAAGNSTSETVGYPARVNNPRIISVGSLDSDNSRSSFSNWGKVEIWAPGGNILSTIPEGATPTDYRRYSDGYAYTDGTSMAAPHVAGVVALMLSVNPNLTPQQLQTNIINNANTITITVPDPGFWPWEWNRTRDIVVQKLNAYEAVKAVAIFNTRILANDTIEIIDTFDRQLTGIIEIPPFLNNRPVKIISHLAFSNQTQLTQITIPSSVTTIGNNAFQNTNNAPIYLEGRTSAPNTFDINWNSSGNPVYLNGNLCTHTSTTLMSINYTQHGHLCNTCRTFVSESNHNHNVEHIPLGTAPSGIAVHSSYCRCGHSVTVPCVSKIPHLPGDTVICTYCGQEFTNPLFMITLPNGESFVSNAPFTYDMFKQLAEHLEISNEYADFVLSTRSSTIDYEYDISLASILPSRKETLYECCE
jgi:thermitase